MTIEDMSKAELKTFIKCYNTYIQDLEYTKGEQPLSIYKFLNTEYKSYKALMESEPEKAKDDLFLIYSQETPASPKINESFCTTIETARKIVDRKMTNDKKLFIAKVELDSELVNEALVEVYDFSNGLEWKSGTNNAEYGDLAKVQLSCDYYEISNKPVDKKGIELVIKTYLASMEKEGWEPEIGNISAKDFVKLDSTVISHVFYHAEMANNPDLKPFFEKLEGLSKANLANENIEKDELPAQLSKIRKL